MAVNTKVNFMYPPDMHEGGTGFSYKGFALGPETPPAIMWGQGTPDGDRAPFNIVNKGSIYLQIDATDDATCIHLKIDEGGDDADWKTLALTA